MTLDELAHFLLHLADTPALAEQASNYLLSLAQPFDTGQMGMWLRLSGVELDRVIDLRGIPRVAGAASIGDNEAVVQLPLPPPTKGTTSVGDLVADFLDEMLERAGYLNLGGRFDYVRIPTAPSPS